MGQHNRLLTMIQLMLVCSLVIGCNSTSTSSSSSKGTSTSFTPTPWYFIGGGDFQHGLIIESVEETGDWIACNFWQIESNGYVHKGSFEANTKNFKIPPLVTPSPVERKSRIEDWKKRGYSVRITDLEGKASEISNALLYYYAPSGYQYVGAQYKVGTDLSINSNGEVKTAEFKEISKLVVNAQVWTITYRDGSKISGFYSPEMYDDLTFRAVIYGIQYGVDGSINAYELPMENVSSIVFLSSPKP